MTSHKTKPRSGWERKYGEFVQADTFTPEIMFDIAGRVGVDGDDEIAKLKVEVLDIANNYLQLLHNLDKRPTDGERKAALVPFASALNQLIDQFEALDEDTRMSLELTAAGSNASSPLAGLLDGEKHPFEVGADIIEQQIGHIYNLRDYAEAALNNVPKPQRGARKKFAKNIMYRKLADVFERYTERRATVRSDGEGGHGGPFVEFVAACLEPMNPKPYNSESALGQQLKEAIRVRRNRVARTPKDE